MLIYSHTISPRLEYIATFIAGHISRIPLQLTNDKEVFQNYEGLRFSYSKMPFNDNEIWIEDSGLLFENGIRSQALDIFKWNHYPIFFRSGGDLSFDILAASFYLLSRYEEYLPYKTDMYGRYGHENSIAYKEGFLDLPLINLWIKELKKIIQQKFPHHIFPDTTFHFLPTYDIDIAWSFKNKGLLRNAGGFARSFLKGDTGSIQERFSVLRGKKKDPFDAYDWMDELHAKYKLNPVYFFLVASANGKQDKNILPSVKEMQGLIRQHSNRYNIGVHPSWQSGDAPSLLVKEVECLEKITAQKINSSRQHFIRFVLPNGYRLLLNAGIEKDYSMGYGSINGFRASVASPFFWYDLEREQTTSLLLHPFCFMDANSFYEQKYSPQQGLQELQRFYKVIKQVDGTMITIWHNAFLGDDKMFAGWKEIYAEWLSEISMK